MPAAETHSETWIGSYGIGTDAQLATVRINNPRNDSTDVTVDIPFERQGGIGAREVKAGASSLGFILDGRSGPTAFAGTIKGDEFKGRVTRNRAEGFFHFTKTQEIDKETLHAYEGVYRLSPTKHVYIQVLDALGDNLVYFDDTGEIRALYPRSTDTFTAGPGLFLPFPLETRLRFYAEGDSAAGMVWERPDSAALRLGRVAHYPREEITFKNGDVELAGDLITPSGPGPHPCIVAVHGSGPQNRNILPYTQLLVHRGFAVLGYDKRGVGASSGHWVNAGIDDLAGDAVAAVRYLQSRDDIRDDAIGLLGGSQGGWIGTLAAAQTSAVAFVVSVSGPGTTPMEQELDRVEAEMRADGFAEDAISQALRLYEAFNRYATTGDGWQEVQTLRESAVGQSWFQSYVYVPSAEDDALIDFWRLILRYDPVPAFRQVKCPVLSLFGAADKIVPAQKNKTLWDAAFRGNPDYASHTFPRANHILLDSHTGSMAEWPQLTRFAPGYFDTLLAWLDERAAGL